MRNRRPSPEHEQAVARRLALLSAELAAVRGEPGGPSPIPTSPPGWQASPELAQPGPGVPEWPWDAHTRVRPGPGAQVDRPLLPHATGAAADQAPPGPPPAGELPALPVPGRHAARRSLGGALLPAGLRGRVQLQPVHLTVVSLLLVVALGWTCWWLVRGQAEPVVTPVSSPLAPPGDAAGSTPLAATLDAPAPSSGGAPTSAPPSGSQPAGEVTVDVAGKVRRPGIAVLPAGSRVVDALEASGGARPGVDLTALNLARVLVDGEQVLVGIKPVSGVVAPAPGAGTAGAPAGLVNINTADQATLETLPGVGPVTATSIIGWRTANGGFTSVDSLVEVDGIGEATLARLAPLVTI